MSFHYKCCLIILVLELNFTIVFVVFLSECIIIKITKKTNKLY